ncbi:hypothetical protein UT300013_33470 [Paraclostridium sordellii]
MDNQRFENLEQRIEMLEFKVKLLSERTNTSQILLEYNISKEQYIKIMDLMDDIRFDLLNKNNVNNSVFESKIYEIIGKDGDYHFCEAIAKAFMEDNRWEEVFPALYGKLPKYKYYMENQKKGE